MPTRIILAALALTCLPMTAHAQTAGEISLQFVSFPKSVDHQPLELLIGDGKTLPIQAPSNTLSQPYKVGPLSEWVIGKTDVISKDGEQKTVFTTYGRTASIPSNNQLILLIRTGKENSDGLRVIAMDNNMDHFGGGQFFFMNAAKIDIAGKVADASFVIKPGTFSIIKPQAGVEEREGMMVAFTKLYYQGKKGATPFFSSTWPVNEKARSMIFFYHDPHNDRLRFHSIRNFIR